WCSRGLQALKQGDVSLQIHQRGILGPQLVVHRVVMCIRMMRAWRGDACTMRLHHHLRDAQPYTVVAVATLQCQCTIALVHNQPMLAHCFLSCLDSSHTERDYESDSSLADSEARNVVGSRRQDTGSLGTRR